MTRASARRLARHLRALGYRVRVRRHEVPGGHCHYTVEWAGRRVDGAPTPSDRERMYERFIWREGDVRWLNSSPRL